MPINEEIFSLEFLSSPTTRPVSSGSLRGPRGYTGAQGPVGPAGADGAPGVNGINGANGATGAQGPIGLTGTTGAAGEDGTDGIDGTNGTDGIDGINGIDGLDGEVGPIGPTGPQGLQGIAGFAGADGSRIFTGTGVPGSGTGADGDFYIRTGDYPYLYGPKTSGSWGSATLLFPAVETGPQDTWGTADGFYKDFILPRIPSPSYTLQVFVNGVLTTSGWTLNSLGATNAGSYISFTTAPLSGDVIKVAMRFNPLTELRFPTGSGTRLFPANHPGTGSEPGGWGSLPYTPP